MTDSDDDLKLTSEETVAEARDHNLMGAIGDLNYGEPLPDSVLEGAMQAPTVEYWASLGNLGKVKLAIQAGEDVNAVSDNEYSALHAAACNGHVEVLKLLLAHGAKIDARLTSGETALDLARLAGEDEATRILEEST